MAATGIPSLQEFGQVLSDMHANLLSQYLKNAPAYPPPGEVLKRPSLNMDPEIGGRR